MPPRIAIRPNSLGLRPTLFPRTPLLLRSLAPKCVSNAANTGAQTGVPKHDKSVPGTTAPASSVHGMDVSEAALLAAQRRQRPLAPHLSIYQPQLTWYMSGANRITSLFLSGTTYLFFLSYLAAPYFGLQLDTATMAATAAGAGVLTKGLAKTLVAVPFFYHGFNSIRHQVWDTGRSLDLKGVYRSGYAVLVGTAIGTVWAVFFA